MTLPKLDEKARNAALEKATRVRRKRSEFKQAISARKITAVDALTKASEDEDLSKLPVSQFLKALPGIGKTKATTLQADMDISETRRIAGLGAKQIERMTEVCQDIDAKA